MSSDTPAEDQPPVASAEDQPPATPAEDSGTETAANASPPSDDPLPDADLAAIVEANAMADALKAVSGAVEDMRSPAPDKRDARSRIRDDYAKAFDDLERKYKDANDRFVRAAADMLRKSAGEKSRLETWIDTWLKPDKNSLRALLYDRKQVRDRLDARAGPRERDRDLAAARTKIWQDAFAGWAAAQTKIAAQINDYGGRIDKLNAQVNTDVDADLAIYSFWFEVAPSHLQLRASPVNGTNAPGVDLLAAALAGFEDALEALKAGPDRGGGSLYLIAPDKLPDKRDAVMTAWRDAAKAQGAAEAAYKLRPDSAAALKARADAQQQNRAADAKALFLKPTN